MTMKYEELVAALEAEGLPIEPLYIQDAVDMGDKCTIEFAVTLTKYRVLLSRGDATEDEIQEMEKEMCRVQGRKWIPPLTDQDRRNIRKILDREIAARKAEKAAAK